MDGLEEEYNKNRKTILRNLGKFCKNEELCEDALHTGYVNCVLRNHTKLFTESYWALSKLMRFNKRHSNARIVQVNNNNALDEMLLKEQTDMATRAIERAPIGVKAWCVTGKSYVDVAKIMNMSPVTLRMQVNLHVNKLRPRFDYMVQDKAASFFFVDKSEEV